MPLDFYPMLASAGSESDLSLGDGWRYEPKLDGIRCLAYVTEAGVALFSRTGKNITAQFPDVVASLAKLQNWTIGRTVLDGEIVAAPIIHEDNLGVHLITSKFQDLQPRLGRLSKLDLSVPCKYICFDLLQHNDYPYITKDCHSRRMKLASMAANDLITLIPGYGGGEVVTKMYSWAISQGAEGFIAKLSNGLYFPGYRSSSWRKIKPMQSIDCNAIASTYGFGRRSNSFGALVLESQGKYIGLVGTGFDDETLASLTAYIKAHPTDQSFLRSITSVGVAFNIVEIEHSFTPFPLTVKYQELTKTGILRFPVFTCLV